MPGADSVFSRPDRSTWAVVALFIFFSLFPFTMLVLLVKTGSAGAVDVLILALFAALCLLPAAIAARRLLCSAAIATDRGITVRSTRSRELTAAWSEVTDYYEEPGTQRTRVRSVVVVSGRRLLFDREWTNYEALRKYVRMHAAGARAKEWAMLGTRSVDEWPRTFSGMTRDAAQARVIFPVLMAAYAGCLVWDAPDYIRRVGEYFASGLILGVGYAVLIPTVMLGLPVAVMWTTIASNKRSVDSIKSLRITVDLRGIAMTTSDHAIEATWDQVRAYYMAPVARGWITSTAYTVETDCGVIAFDHTLKDAHLLSDIIKAHAVNLERREWRSRVPDEIPDTLPKVVAVASQDRQIFTYRTRLNQATLWYPAALCIAFGFLWALHHAGIVDPPPPTSQLGAVFMVLFALTAYGCWRYRAAKIVLDDRGISQFTVSGVKVVSWDEVEAFKFTRANVLSGYTVTGEHGRIWFSVLIGRAPDLVDEIARLSGQPRPLD